MKHAIILLTQIILQVASEATGQETGPLPFGYLIVGIIEAPVLILLLATFLGKPRQPKITAVFLGFIGIMAIIFISAVFGLSYLLGIFY